MTVTRYYLTEQERIYADNNQLHLIPAADQRNPEELSEFIPEKPPERVYTGKYARLTKKYLIEQLATGITVRQLAKKLGMPRESLSSKLFEYGITEEVVRGHEQTRDC
ncbi:hypothetical protein [Paenibacillus senegalensis]|uniref:hypothetical protein n=1 Tax=Paenibacillus senegalensis TaxID=1465766 RepID=UPI000289616B|nr:hypothetical protein [Paenibacillus senegalensis]